MTGRRLCAETVVGSSDSAAPLGTRVAELVPALVQGIQELKATVAAQQWRLTAQQRSIGAQQDSIEALRAQNVALLADNAAFEARLASLERSSGRPVFAMTH